jgi:RNA polymerase sigma-70 factor (ECF subfamily)
MSDPFLQHRPNLFALAYRMLGSAAEAEDIVQEAWLRWREAENVESPKAWLSTVVARLCLDALKSARARRETYVGPWLPEPIATSPDEIDPESVSLAFLTVLERLTPVERAAYLLHAVFDYSHSEVASMLGKDEASVRQIFHRAKARVTEQRPRFAASKEAHARLLEGFAQACLRGDVEGLRAMLAEDVVAWSDGGGKRRAALKPVYGSDAVARLFIGLVKKGSVEGREILHVEVNGWPALAGNFQGTIDTVVAIQTDGAKIYAVYVVVNPDKLGRLAH